MSTPAVADPRIGISAAEFGALINKSYETVRVAVHKGQIPATRIGRRVLIPMAYVEAVRNGEDTSRFLAKPEPAAAAEPLDPIEEHVRQLVASAPPMPDDLIDRIVGVLRSHRVDSTDAR